MMEPGRELDALVCEKIMGWREWDWVIDGCSRSGPYSSEAEAHAARPKLERRFRVGELVVGNNVPAYSTHTAADVKERLRTHYQYYVTVGDSAAFPPSVMPLESDSFICIIGVHEHLIARAQGITEEHAVCLAALKVAELTP